MTHENEPLCAGCGKPFTAEEWADRHWSDDDIDAEYHAECCPAPECLDCENEEDLRTPDEIWDDEMAMTAYSDAGYMMRG